jgi:hypothetical protein
MTDPMKPLGLSMWQLTTPRTMAEAGGRLFVDVTQMLASPASREALVTGMGRSDPLIGDALRTVLERGDFIPLRPDEDRVEMPVGTEPVTIETDPDVVTELIERGQASIAALRRDIQAKSGPELFDFILADLQELKRVLFDPRGLQVILAAMQATWRLNEQLEAWAGREERGRRAHPVGPSQRHVGDGAGAA